LASASFSVEKKKREGRKINKSRQATELTNQGKTASMEVVTFGSTSIFTVPNKLGTDAKKILYQRLLKKGG
jgi:hypothetical protein